MGLILRSTLSDAVDSTWPGAFHYDPVSGNNLNNGILVGENGSGTTLNGTAGTGARQTEAQFRTDMAAGRYSPGDLVYIRPPGFVFTDGFLIRSNSTSLDANTKLVIRSLPGEKLNTTLDLSTNAISLPGGQGANPIVSFDSNIVIQSFIFSHMSEAWGSGGQTGQGTGSSLGCEWLDLLGVLDGLVSGGDNGGVWKLQDNGEGGIIAGCHVDSQHNPGATSNKALLYWIGLTDLLIAYNDFEFDGTGGGGGGGPLLHHKRSTNTTEVRIINNMLSRIGGGNRNDTFHGGGTARHTFRNNIQYGASFSWGHSNGASGSDPTCSNMIFEHETLYGGLFLTRDSSVSGSGDDNFVRSCVIGGAHQHWPSITPIQATGLLSNYNHGDGSAPYIRYFGSDYTLAQWQAIVSGDTGQDANSVDEAVNYEAGVQDPDDPTSFRLDAASAGKGTAHDATDMGADVDEVGPSAMPTNMLWLNGTTKLT